MTITTYYNVFGFLIKKSDYLKCFGYTMENLPEDYDQDESVLFDWIVDEHYGNPYSLYKVFEIDGLVYTLRGFTHDSDLAEYLVIGVDLGSIDRETGKRTEKTYTDDEDFKPTNLIQGLFDEPDWLKLIQECDKYNGWYVEEDWRIPHPIREGTWISPQVYITTDDCDCCS